MKSVTRRFKSQKSFTLSHSLCVLIIIFVSAGDLWVAEPDPAESGLDGLG